MTANRSTPRVLLGGPCLSGQLTTIGVIGRMQEATFDALAWATRGEYELAVQVSDARFTLRQMVRTNVVHDVIDDADRDPRYRAERDYLREIDGIIFIADSQEERLDANVEHLRRLESVLGRLGRHHAEVAMVIALNKRDLPSAMSIKDLADALRWPRGVYVATVAKRGDGVLDVVRTLVGLMEKPGR